MKPIRIGLVGIGKIARDQHIPALRADRAFDLAACASRNADVDGARNYRSIEAMLDGEPDLEAVAICTPPQFHFDAARLALGRGKHVFLEKPPCATTAELDALATLARAAGRTLFQSWHSRYAAAVEPARRWLAGKTVRAGRIVWKEDVRHWHPGQTWIWEAGGFGIFDPGINAISILTAILPEHVRVARAHFLVPSNCAAPIAAEIDFEAASGAAIRAEMDFRHTGVQTWDIDVETDGDTLKLSNGGADMAVNGERVAVAQSAGEYPLLYRRFASLAADGASDVDVVPFQLVADAFLVARHTSVEPFE
ncbi:MAG TPA: Gfo/Idh/MocA family oxidoreductase [Rhizomicrobium sp.]|nr:Gfo/Idh/MocA family oxidoreductase [Rhizomicrobium sp.]